MYVSTYIDIVLQQKSINCNWIGEIVFVDSRSPQKQETLISLINVSIGQTKYFGFGFTQGLILRLNLDFLIFFDSFQKYICVHIHHFFLLKRNILCFPPEYKRSINVNYTDYA
jgi:hypothetical protein